LHIVAINGSPRSGKISKSSRLLEAFISGCREAGANVELVNLREKKIKPCTGCYSCWIKTPGQCIQKDDVAEILAKLRSADLEVWSTPLYFFGPTGLVKNFLDRNLPLAEPFIIEKNGLCSHPLRNGNIRNIFFMSVAGFYEIEHFRPISNWLHFMAERGLFNIKGEIYRTSSEFMIAPPLKEQVDLILGSARKAGNQIVTKGAVDQDIVDAIQIPLIPTREEFISLANAYWDWEIRRNQT
jgi:FMN-dependent NADH-azoreductase